VKYDKKLGVKPYPTISLSERIEERVITEPNKWRGY